jgi:asparagine synthase (glutamine-hydrolysing)
LWKIGIKTASSFPPGNVATIEEQGFKFKPVKTLAYSKPEQITLQAAAEKLQTFLRRAVRERVAGLKEIAVAFSGGLDSSLIAYLAKQTGADVHLVHVSLENQSETEHARRAAEELKLPLHVHLYKETDVEKTLPEVLWLIEEPDPLKTSIGIPFYWTAENTVKMNINVLLAGQGADELFGGYKRYVDEYVQHGDEKLRNTFFNDIVKLHKTNLERDSKICAFQGVELRLPFIAWSMAEFALKLPTELKIGLPNKENRKLILRQIAKNIGLTQLIAGKPKKALQYTTGVSKALERIARKEGLSPRDHLERTFQTILRKDCENE